MNSFEVFATVFEQKSLIRASKILNLSQPALSRKIMKLEQELAVQLFERKGKRLEITRAGKICYEYVLKLRQIEREFQINIQSFQNTKQNKTITIGASLTTLQATLPDLITWYAKEHPHHEIKALTGKTHEIVRLVVERKVDIGLIASVASASGVRCDPLFDDHLVLVVSNKHPFAKQKKISIHDLHHLPMILFSKGTWYRILMDELFQRFSIMPEVYMEIDSFEAIIRLLSTSQMATLLPKSYLRADLIHNNQLFLHHLNELEQTTRTTSLIYLEKAVEEPLLEEFIQITRDFFINQC